MIQPFWTIPLLAIAGLHMRQIMGYTFVIFFSNWFFIWWSDAIIRFRLVEFLKIL